MICEHQTTYSVLICSNRRPLWYRNLPYERMRSQCELINSAHTCKLTGDQSIKLTILRSLMRCSALWTCVGSTVPSMMFNIDMNLPCVIDISHFDRYSNDSDTSPVGLWLNVKLRTSCFSFAEDGAWHQEQWFSSHYRQVKDANVAHAL